MRKLLAFLLFAIVSFAQQTPHPTRAIYFTATHENAPVKNLELIDLDVKGARPVSLQEIADSPLWVGVLVDQSRSVGRLTQQERIDGISEGLALMLRSGTDTAMLVNFNENFYLDQTGTTDVSALTRVLRDKADPRGGSAILDSVRASSSYLLQHLPAALPRVIFLFSDCADNASKSTIDQALHQLQVNGTRLYVFKEPADGRQIGVEQHGASMLKLLAEGTGGRVIEVDYRKKSKHRLTEEFKKIEPELRSWYRLYLDMTPVSDGNVRATPIKIRPRHSRFEVQAQSDIFISSEH